MTIITKKILPNNLIDDEIQSFILSNRQGASISVLNFGAAISEINVPDRNGVMSNVVLSYSDSNDYFSDKFFLGSTVGPYANRIRGGKFMLDGEPVQLATGENGHHLHGESAGVHLKAWNSAIIEQEGDQALVLSLALPDGEGGYPGERCLEVIYFFSEDNELTITFKATSSKKTIVNLANHSYFNLSPRREASATEHVLTINADKYLEVDEAQIPTGEVKDVTDTPFDFRSPAIIAHHLDREHEQLKIGQGFDQCYMLNKQSEGGLELAAALYDLASGRKLQVITDQPGLQFYSGNHLQANTVEAFFPGAGVCLETQHFPDAPNHAHFPSVVLEPGELFESKTIYRFSNFNQ